MKGKISKSVSVLLSLFLLVSMNTVTFADETSDEEKLKGDFNMDNVVSVEDITLLQKYCATLISLDDENYDFSTADIDGNGEISITDATILQIEIS